MKLIQYRFSPEALTHACSVGEAVQALFEGTGDIDLRSVHVERGDIDRLVSRHISASEVGKALTRSLIESYSDIVSYSDYVSVRSNTSCRFVIVEDDGLLRICHAHLDPIINFTGLQHTAEDVSELLIKTDLFD
jgi:hypothetical protein